MFNDTARKERLDSLIILLKQVNANIICLQETTDESLKILKKELFNYNLLDLYESRGYREIILYKNLQLLNKKLVILPSNMGRTLTSAVFNDNGFKFQIVTFHLESLDSFKLRNLQMRHLLNLVDFSLPVVCCGDSNLKSGEPGLSELTGRFKDLGIYYDNSPTSHGDRFFGTRLKERYDRVWISGCETNRFELIGNLKIPGKNFWISDHDGILFNIIPNYPSLKLENWEGPAFLKIPIL